MCRPFACFLWLNLDSGGPKGLGELPMDGPAPAIVNAIEDAIGASINQVPLMPEDLMRVMSGP